MQARATSRDFACVYGLRNCRRGNKCFRRKRSKMEGRAPRAVNNEVGVCTTSLSTWGGQIITKRLFFSPCRKTSTLPIRFSLFLSRPGKLAAEHNTHYPSLLRQSLSPFSPLFLMLKEEQKTRAGTQFARGKLITLVSSDRGRELYVLTVRIRRVPTLDRTGGGQFPREIPMPVGGRYHTRNGIISTLRT